MKKYKKHHDIMVLFIFFHQSTTPACRAAVSTDRSDIAPTHNGAMSEVRPTTTYERQRISELG